MEARLVVCNIMITSLLYCGSARRMADGSNWAFITSGGILSVDDSLWVDQNGRPHPTQQLVIAADTGKGALHISWQLRHLG